MLGLGPLLIALASAAEVLEPTSIPKYEAPLVIPPAMPRTDKIVNRGGKNTDYYEIAVRQFDQQILPMGFPATTVWSYGSVNHPGTFNYPAFTIEAKANTPVRVKWINDLKDPVTGNYLPHLLPVDQTLHWANPPGGLAGRDTRALDPTPYTGPVPIVTHVHGSHTSQESDGYPEAWYLPAANNIPAGYATAGTFYDIFRSTASQGAQWGPGSAVFEYPNDQRATTLWYHDHTLGMTRLNVYAGPAGFYLLRGGPSDLPSGDLPGPAPALGDPPGTAYYEIPIGIQDRTFDVNGQLWYPDNRAFFEGLTPDKLQIRFIPDLALDTLPPGLPDGIPDRSDISPIWNPEFFGNTIVVNGKTWPQLSVEQRRYRFRFLNGCQSRFLILKMAAGDPTERPEGKPATPFWLIGTEGGFLPAPVPLDRLLLGPAERMDVIVDFSKVRAGTSVYLINLGPDEPFGGGEPDDDFDSANPLTTGQVMRFDVVKRHGADRSTRPEKLALPALAKLPAEVRTRKVSLNELDSQTVLVSEGEGEEEEEVIVLDPNGEPFGPMAALLGTVENSVPGMPMGMPMGWMHEVTENPGVGDTEIWEIHNFTMDAHPIHIHQVMFEVIDRAPMPMEEMAMVPLAGRPAETWEAGLKDTVIAYPGEITRVKAKFDIPGLFVWHCHILEHEDNEMMRPYRVGP